jgi:hypothetical protein
MLWITVYIGVLVVIDKVETSRHDRIKQKTLKALARK